MIEAILQCAILGALLNKKETNAQRYAREYNAMPKMGSKLDDNTKIVLSDQSMPVTFPSFDGEVTLCRKQIVHSSMPVNTKGKARLNPRLAKPARAKKQRVPTHKQ